MARKSAGQRIFAIISVLLGVALLATVLARPILIHAVGDASHDGWLANVQAGLTVVVFLLIGWKYGGHKLFGQKFPGDEADREATRRAKAQLAKASTWIAVLIVTLLMVLAAVAIVILERRGAPAWFMDVAPVALSFVVLAGVFIYFMTAMKKRTDQGDDPPDTSRP